MLQPGDQMVSKPKLTADGRSKRSVKFEYERSDGIVWKFEARPLHIRFNDDDQWWEIVVEMVDDAGGKTDVLRTLKLHCIKKWEGFETWGVKPAVVAAVVAGR